jgi:methionyl aminopeptidase
VICHGIPDQRELQDGDIVNVDVTAFIGGWHGDLNETFCVGKVRRTSQGFEQDRIATACKHWPRTWGR